MWVVTENTPGYLPDSEPAAFTTLRVAHSYAADLARDLRAEGYRVVGSKGFYSAENPDRIHDLGRVIETVWVESEDM